MPALALPAAAALAMPAASALAGLIRAHVAAKAAFAIEMDALEAASPDASLTIQILDYPPLKIGYSPDDLLESVDKVFDREAAELAKLALIAPEIAEAARARLEQEREAQRARVEEIFADYQAADARYRAACRAEEDAVTAICAHRCATMDELAVKARHLSRLNAGGELIEPHVDALLASMLPEGESPGLGDQYWEAI